MAKTLPTRKVSYLGARAEVKEIRQAGPNGEREIRTRWIDKAVGQPIEWEAGTIVSRTITGNALKGNAVVLVEQHIVNEF